MNNKESLRQAIILALQANLDTATRAANAAKETATSKETVAENKYDTFGLEASYLAHGQSKRVEELLCAIKCYTSMPLKEFSEDDEIDISALVTVSTDNDDVKHFFLGPEAGGLKIECQDKTIMVITPSTPLGKQLLGKQLDDVIKISTTQTVTTYEITDLH